MAMNKVVRILMTRDGMSLADATRIVAETKEEILESDPFLADDIIMLNLGLEPDYIFDILE